MKDHEDECGSVRTTPERFSASQILLDEVAISRSASGFPSCSFASFASFVSKAVDPLSVSPTPPECSMTPTGDGRPMARVL